MTEEVRNTLIKAQQGELDGVETYKMLADVVHNEDDVKAFKVCLRGVGSDIYSKAVSEKISTAKRRKDI